jgi:hypothetical protein
MSFFAHVGCGFYTLKKLSSIVSSEKRVMCKETIRKTERDGSMTSHEEGRNLLNIRG